jgi:hypothetical protein
MDWNRGSLTGGILNLILTIKENEVELTSDFRQFYGISLTNIPQTVSYKEAILLIYSLETKTESLYFAKKNKWKYPASKEYLILADLIDVLIASNSSKKNIKPYPRPFKTGNKNVSGTAVSLTEAKELYKIKRREEPSTE